MWWLPAFLACSAELESASGGAAGDAPEDGPRAGADERQPSLSELRWDEHHSVIIIGGGPAGLAVAGSLDDGLLLEASATLGGRWPEGAELFLIGTEAQAEAGESDSIEAVLEDWQALTGSPPTDQTRRWLDGMAELYDRLVELGLRFTTLEADPVLGRRRAHLTDPATSLVGLLSAEVATEVRLETPVEDVIIHEGRALGVKLWDGSRLRADAVVIASGGFVTHSELLGETREAASRGTGTWGAAVVPLQLADAPEETLGSALLWARAHDWGTANLDDIGWHRRSLALLGDARGPLSLQGMAATLWVWVDANGARFANEAGTHSVSLSTPYLAHSPVWGIATQDDLEGMVDDPEGTGEEATALAENIGNNVICDDSAESLAEAVGIDPEGLQATLDAMADTVASRQIDETGRGGPGTPDLLARPLCAFDTGMVASKNFGGLAIDEEFRVLDQEGDPISGLYAVGEAAGMAGPGLGGANGFDGSGSAILWGAWTLGESLNP